MRYEFCFLLDYLRQHRYRQAISHYKIDKFYWTDFNNYWVRFVNDKRLASVRITCISGSKNVERSWLK